MPVPHEVFADIFLSAELQINNLDFSLNSSFKFYIGVNILGHDVVLYFSKIADISIQITIRKFKRPCQFINQPFYQIAVTKETLVWESEKFYHIAFSLLVSPISKPILLMQ